MVFQVASNPNRSMVLYTYVYVALPAHSKHRGPKPALGKVASLLLGRNYMRTGNSLILSTTGHSRSQQ